ncbi:MAG TPA: (5-formylfuran-3-yl)methyl phosphate synthase [Gemmatimonadales bacterium]
MPLLVSVRSGEEVAAALEGGAGIIDAKEPARGSLGAVDPDVLAAIAGRTPATVPLSVALGDCVGVEQARAAVSSAPLPERSAPVYLKLGFAGLPPAQRITALLEVARRSVAGRTARVVAVAYADHGAAHAPAPEDVLRAAVTAGASGLLVDTWRKDGRGLLDHVPLERLAGLSARARAAGMVFAVAGSLDITAIARLAAIADVIGVRGAACRGGRSGTVDAGLVRGLRRCLEHARAGGAPEVARLNPGARVRLAEREA